MSLIGPNRLKAVGRACPLCPLNSDVNLFRYPERVVELDAEVADRALDLRVAEGFRCADRSTSPWYAVTSGCCRCTDRDRCLRSTRRQGVRIGALSWAGRSRGGW